MSPTAVIALATALLLLGWQAVRHSMAMRFRRSQNGDSATKKARSSVHQGPRGGPEGAGLRGGAASGGSGAAPPADGGASTTRLVLLGLQLRQLSTDAALAAAQEALAALLGGEVVLDGITVRLSAKGKPVVTFSVFTRLAQLLRARSSRLAAWGLTLEKELPPAELRRRAAQRKQRRADARTTPSPLEQAPEAPRPSLATAGLLQPTTPPSGATVDHGELPPRHRMGTPPRCGAAQLPPPSLLPVGGSLLLAFDLTNILPNQHYTGQLDGEPEGGRERILPPRLPTVALRADGPRARDPAQEADGVQPGGAAPVHASLPTGATYTPGKHPAPVGRAPRSDAAMQTSPRAGQLQQACPPPGATVWRVFTPPWALTHLEDSPFPSLDLDPPDPPPGGGQTELSAAAAAAEFLASLGPPAAEAAAGRGELEAATAGAEGAAEEGEPTPTAVLEIPPWQLPKANLVFAVRRLCDHRDHDGQRYYAAEWEPSWCRRLRRPGSAAAAAAAAAAATAAGRRRRAAAAPSPAAAQRPERSRGRLWSHTSRPPL